MRLGQFIKGILSTGAVALFAFLGGMPATTGYATNYELGSPDQTIEILCTLPEGCGFHTGTTIDGTVFTAMPNPSEPATGTGVFDPFLRVQSNGNPVDVEYGDTPDSYDTESGFNTDASAPTKLNYDTKSGIWTHSVQIKDIDISNGFVTLDLDANEEGRAGSVPNQILITEMQIFVGSGSAGFDAPEDTNIPPAGCDASVTNPKNSNTCFGYTGEIFDDTQTDNTLLGQTPEWSLDNGANGNVDLLLSASICNTNGQCGSGQGDLRVEIPVQAFAGGFGSYDPNDYFVFYFEAARNHAGFEEWSVKSCPAGQVCTPPTTTASEPGTIGLFGIALVGMGYIRRRRHGMNS